MDAITKRFMVLEERIRLLEKKVSMKKNKPQVRKKRAVLRFDINEKNVIKYESAYNASKRTGINRVNITHSCNNNKQNTAGGYIWRFVDKMQDKKRIAVLKAGKTIDIFKSEEAAAKAYGYDIKKIISAVKDNKDYQGLKWVDTYVLN